ncbi:MAG TPA: hypothetical protein VF796_11240 [Humisphaera sp.]
MAAAAPPVVLPTLTRQGEQATLVFDAALLAAAELSHERYAETYRKLAE